jgi:BirA family biotin operon repressor/biotin-[acetyl-CoA-carboxylase] ligase
LYAEEIHAALHTHWLAREIQWFDSLDSTNRVALELAVTGAVHGTVVVAESQSAGRGRLGRSFFSPPYQNVYTSLLLRPQITTGLAPAFTLAAAVAVADAVAETVADESAVEIKWPNDVLLGGRKTCGILSELGAEATRVAYLVLGIGVNLNVDPAGFPEEFRARATSLSGHLGRPVDRVAFTARLYEALERSLDACAEKGLDGILPRFEARFRMRGRHVRVLGFDGSVTAGQVRGIDGDGSLVLVDDAGRETRVVAGDVTLEKEGL